MPYLTKQILSHYIGSDCQRQLRLSLARGEERAEQGMPRPDDPRPGLEQIAQTGEEWQAQKLHDLTVTFGAEAVVGDPFTHASGETRYRTIRLRDALARATADQFIVEAEFEVGPAFQAAIGATPLVTEFDLRFAAARPDLLEVLSPGAFPTVVLPGGEVQPLPDGDERLQLRAIDIKLTAEPSAGYFAEVAYYMMALAGWLEDAGLADRFVVVEAGALWPGSHEAAAVRRRYRAAVEAGTTPSVADLHRALAEDLEVAPFDIFAFRIRRFFRSDLPEVLRTPWRALPWHVDTRCGSCDYLGLSWNDPRKRDAASPDYCLPMAEAEDALCRIPFLSRGAVTILRERGVSRVATLADRAAQEDVYDDHQALRANRTVIPGRAQALHTGTESIPDPSSTSASMPRWVDLHVYLEADFDQGSAITFALGISAFWRKPAPFGARDGGPRPFKAWRPQVLVIPQRSLEAERAQLLSFLRAINNILTEAKKLDDKTSVQFYLWDQLQFDHLARVIGRHLDAILADGTVQHLAWLFPSEEQVANPAQVLRTSPITIVKEVVRSVLALPVPHYYSLVQTARVYHQTTLDPNVARFNIHPLYEVPLSDQIPSERAHDVWSQGGVWAERVAILRETVEKRLRALVTVTLRLETDLRTRLRQKAPTIQLGPPRPLGGAAFDSQLWYVFARLDEALNELKVQQIRAMPSHEREARFRSARLTRRLQGDEERLALERLDLPPVPHRRVYALSPGSREVRLHEGDFNVALSPGGDTAYLDRYLVQVAGGTPLAPPDTDRRAWQRMEELTKVTVVAIDRDAGLIVLDPDRRNGAILEDLERFGLADFTQNATLDRLHRDYFTPVLKSALEALGNPPSAREHQRVRRALGQLGRRGARQSAETPAAELLWKTRDLAETALPRDLSSVRAALVPHGVRLNESQWQAWEQALTRRLHLIWGPPGTGKSHTARAVIAGAVLDAHRRGRPLRVLISAFTYRAMDNLVEGLAPQIRSLPAGASVVMRRLRSSAGTPNPALPPDLDLEVSRWSASDAQTALIARLEEGRGITIVAATAGQVHNLMVADEGSAQRELFELILIDEASQMDVAHAIVALCSLAAGGSVVLAGDWLQLPPIRQAEPPKGLEAMVGSIYQFAREQLDEGDTVPGETMLLENYRSNRTIVDFGRMAGYRAGLSAASPDLRLNLVRPLPAERPAGWPDSLLWTPEWGALLDPSRPASCFVYPEGRSSQSNRFEADAVAALLRLLYGRLAPPAGERDPTTGDLRSTPTEPYEAETFWRRAVGVVTPHRAQQALVVGRLQEVFGDAGVSPALIRDAVDTVERFQGQERDLIVASFALGDPDQIAEEDEFLMSLNRFNVMASRARTKVILFVPQEVVNHISGDLETLRGSRLLKLFVESFCRSSRPMTLGFRVDGVEQKRDGLFKSR